MGNGVRKYKEQAEKWYKSARWKHIRQSQLSRQPYCQCPHHKGQKIKAEVVDHKIPHKGDSRLFWDTSNLQSMTKQCHDSFKQSQERGGSGFNRGCDEFGNPLNDTHSWWQ